MTPDNRTAPIDLTRLNRADRRNLLRSKGIKVPGRTLPYRKAKGWTHKDYANQLATELKAEEKAREKKK